MKQMIRKQKRRSEEVRGFLQRFHGREIDCVWKNLAVRGPAGGSFPLEPSAVDLSVGQTAASPFCPGIG